ncbi:hypothetical protein [Methylobacterium sp. E-046]|uniref:hypothetical protein n=1 Tax=Methylobacterium sp. E-046 TaxID=2836576 RepID=UPI001FB92E5B|nr:hypothetical protein [Methylobacterium sp. E-046]MCJ2099359.1 hypothetical protein [Methylobacterium sp. E-046]
MNAIAPRKLSTKVDGVVPTPNSHPHLFASRRRAGASADEGLAFADSYFATKRGTAAGKAAAPVLAVPGHGAFANLPPASVDRMRGGSPVTEATAEQVDAYFANRQAARERSGRR